MFGIESKDMMWIVLGIAYAIYCGWAKYCEHRWPTPPDSDV